MGDLQAIVKATLVMLLLTLLKEQKEKCPEMPVWLLDLCHEDWWVLQPHWHLQELPCGKPRKSHITEYSIYGNESEDGGDVTSGFYFTTGKSE